MVAEHIFSVDVEDYFQVSAFERLVDRSRWHTYPSRVAQNVERLLELLDRHEASATFFVLGWIADQHASVVRRIAAAGHEIASHGWWHQRIEALSADSFRADIRRSKATLEQISGQCVRGYRAPSFSITPGKEWVFDILIEEGYEYDSSLFPIRRTGYGYPTAVPLPHFIKRGHGTLLEFPVATFSWRGIRLPAGGGGYFRLLPYALTRRALRECSLSGFPATFYIHPWEIDLEQPRLRAPLLTMVRHYGGIHDTLQRLEQLLTEFRFTSISRCLSLHAPGSFAAHLSANGVAAVGPS